MFFNVYLQIYVFKDICTSHNIYLHTEYEAMFAWDRGYSA